MYFLRGKHDKNFFTSFDSSILSPNAADFDDNSDSLPTKSSIFSVSFIFKRSNSVIKVCSRASRTLSAPTYRVLIASHTFLAVSSPPVCKIIVSGMD